jgi:hypothetical protein
MPRQTKLHFNHITHYDSERPFSGLTFALRTDANHATGVLRQNPPCRSSGLSQMGPFHFEGAVFCARL